MRYAVDIVGGKVRVVGCFKFNPGSDCVDIQSHMGCKGSRYDYMYSHSINTRAAARAGFIRVLSPKYKDGSPWEIFGDDK